ncbi:MAG: DUF881 domain-containing protein [Deltaproteobacteria bacterium]
MKAREAQISIAVVCLILGIMMMVQFKTNMSDPNSMSTEQISGLTVQMQNLQDQRDKLAAEVLSLRSKMTKPGRGGDTNALRDELGRVNLAAGLVPVKGPGVIVSLDDSLDPLQNDPGDYLIHDNDVLSVVNELKAAGAEAISVNGQRIVAMSEIRCAGPTILVNMTKVAPPFEIKAIGDPEILQSSMRIKGGYLEYMQIRGIRADVQKAEILEIPAYQGTINLKFARKAS